MLLADINCTFNTLTKEIKLAMKKNLVKRLTLIATAAIVVVALSYAFAPEKSTVDTEEATSLVIAKADFSADAIAKCGEGKCGDGKCGEAKKDSTKKAECKKDKEKKCGEGDEKKCGDGEKEEKKCE